ncbi:GGDEF domain-containing protein [Thiocystis violacea]|uniref:GGDEF domain-containing protein n=1 Tax=Thiocystis violacea TaxID=13725 RepID=UPI0019085B72|nr:GGDEF domain-containing protein [Thiocystis violacea]MBK1719791.1 hypothetical protein [Thiocystis violacea]
MTPAIRDALQFCPNLPTLPGVAVRILEMGRDPDVHIGVLAGVLARDPALSSRILRVCNSPLYAKRRTTSNLHQAVMLLGLNSTMTMALSFTLSEVYHVKASHRRTLDHIWRRSIIAALISRLLGEEMGLGSLDELYLAALLQDLGILALHASLPERYGPLLESFETHDGLIELERQALGSDHGEAGAWLMRHWELPERLAVTAEAVHDPDDPRLPEELKASVHCVTVAGQLADFFLSEGRAPGLDAAASSARRWLGLEEAAMESLVDRALQALPEMSALFEIEVVTPQMATGLLDQAREVLATRNLRLMHQAAEHHQKVIEMEEAAELLQRAAIHDSLTGLHNRRHFDHILELEFALATENTWPLTMGFIDLDHFKEVNDAHGHVTGDSVLVRVASVLKKNLRERDYIMRYGGEEFVVLLPGHGLEEARHVFERLRRAVESTQHKGDSGTPFRVTNSIGVASHMGGEHRFEEAIDLVRAADRALYDAKRQGRNRVIVYSGG